MQRVWNNCRQYIGHQSGAVAGMENPFLEAVNHLETLWNELYSRHVLKLIETKKKLIKKKQESLSVLSKGLMDLAPVSNTMSLSDITSLTTKPTVSSIETNEAALELPHNRDVTSEHHVSWSHCSSVLSLWEYIDLPANTRLNLLSWLCFEIMDTEYISNFMSNLTAFKIPITRTYKTGDEDGSDDDAIGAASSLTPGKSKLPIIKKRMSSSSLVGSSNTTLSEGVSDENADFGYSVMRWTGLGKDRDGRLYWVFNAPDINKIESKDESGVSSVLDEIRENRLYCEDVATGDWIIYDRVDDINFLLAWLTDKTICESQLQKALITWMKASEIPITVTPQSTMVKRSKKSMSADEANLGESENIQLLTRNKSAGAGAESVDYSGHWMTKSTHAVAVLVDIYLVDGITSPGIGMLRADNAMFVTGFRRDGNNRSLGEEAGLRVGDMIVAVNGRAVAGNIDVIRDTMAAILEPTKASESTQDEETTTGTTIQKKSTAGSTEKVKSRKSNTTASNGTDNNESVTGSVNQIYNTVFETTPRLQVLVLRRTDPMSFSGFRELSNREPTIKSSWIEFLAQRNAYLSLTVSDDNCGDLIKSTVGSLSEAYPTNSVTVKSQSTTTSRRRAAAAAEAEAKAIARADAESAANTAAAAATAKTAFLSSKLPSTDLLNPMTDRAYYAGSLVGGLLDLLMRTNHPYAVPDEWTDRRNEWIEKLHHCMAEINKIYSLIRVYKYFMQIPLDSFRAVDKSKLASKKSQGHQYFKHLRDNLHQARLQLLSTERACMLEFEQILYLGGNILTSEWLDNRTRQKWHSLCQQPLSTTAQVSLVCFQLISAVDFKRLASANVSMTRKKWFETGVAKNYLFYSGSANSNTTTATTTATSIVKASASSSSTSLTKKELKAQQSQQQVVRTSQEEDELTQLSIPIEGSVVIYYGDGHMEAYQRGQSKQLPKMWGESAKPYSGHIFLCLVRSVRVLLCGSLESGRYFPFAQVDLIVIDKSAYASSPRIIKTAPSDHAGLTYRLVNRLINTLEHCPESVPFLTAVNVSDHPDYLKIVKKPTDLSLIKKKARNGDYSTCEQFKSDITLLRDNCHKYCSELYPELVTYADQLYEEFSRLYDMLVSELLLLPSGNHVKDESTSFSNSSNNNIDMISKVSSTTSNATVSESTGISFKFSAKIIAEKFAIAIRVAPTGFAVRGIFKPKGTLPTSMEPIGGLSAAATSSFTVCVRLGEGSSSLEASPFLIEIDLYKRLCESVEISSHVILKSSIALPHLCSDTVQAAPFPRVVSSLFNFNLILIN